MSETKMEPTALTPSEMRELPKRLRGRAQFFDEAPLDASRSNLGKSADLFREAADRIEELERDNARMREALENIHDLEMGRGDGVVGDYVEEVRALTRSALPKETT